MTPAARSETPITPIIAPAVLSSPVGQQPQTAPIKTDYAEPPRKLAWVAPILAIFTALAIGALIYAYITNAEQISPIGYGALILAIILPAVSIAILWTALRAFTAAQTQAVRLEAAATRLTTPTESVKGDVERLIDSIQGQLSELDRRLAISKSEVETLEASVSTHSQVLGNLSQTMAQRSSDIIETTTAHRTGYETLIAQLSTQLDSATRQAEEWRAQFGQTGETVASDIATASQSLKEASTTIVQSGEDIVASSGTATERLAQADETLKSRALSLTSTLNQIDETLERQADRLGSLSENLAQRSETVDQSFVEKTDTLSKLDAQSDAAEVRLTRLLNRATDIRDEMMARFAELETAMEAFDNRSRQSAEDMSSRLNDALSTMREDIAEADVKITELKRTVSNIPKSPAPAQTHSTTLQTYVQTEQKTPAPAPNLELQPLDEADLRIPDEPSETLELSEEVKPQNPEPTSDVIRRPGADVPPAKVFGRSKSKDRETKDTDKSGWRWRDMLGGLDHSSAQPDPQPILQRPPAGVPLSPPPPAPPLPDGSDVVARLCEVKLAPSAIVDEGTIIDATSARMAGGEDRQVDVVVTRLNAPVLHLRGVLAADLEFKLRAETFRRNYDHHLSSLKTNETIRAEMGSASGRAYLLCAAALKTA